jgi:hypothetical protein
MEAGFTIQHLFFNVEAIGETVVYRQEIKVLTGFNCLAINFMADF